MPPQGGNAGLGNAQGKITIDTRDLTRTEATAQKVGQSVSNSLGKISTGAKRAESSTAGLRSAFGALGITVGAATGVQLARIAVDLAQVSAQAERLSGAFGTLASGVGQSSAGMLNAMQRASRGMVSDADLMLSANRSMLLGVADTAEELGQLLDVARVRGRAMGLSLSQAFNDIVTGIGRMSPLILDNLGIVVDAEKTFAEYGKTIGKAADDLTDAERKQALLNRVLKDSQPLLAAASSQADTNADQFEKAAASWANARVQLGELTSPTIVTGVQRLAEVLTQLNDALKKWQSTNGKPTSFGDLEAQGIGAIVTPQRMAADLNRQIAGLRNIQSGMLAGRERALEDLRTGARPRAEAQANLEEMDAKLADVNGQLTRLNAQLAQTGVGFASARFDTERAPSRGRGISAAIAPDWTEEQTMAMRDYARSVADIERQSGEARLDATRQYESQRTEAIANYEKTIARDAQDFARQRLRQWADLERDISEIQADTAEQEAKWWSDLQERLDDLRGNSNKRVAELEENYQKDRERRARSHGATILDAAARLDAVAIAQEQRRYAEEEADAKEAHKEQVDDERESLEERTAQEQEAHEERVREAREAEAERIRDMRESLAEQQREEDEDRKLRLERMAQDQRDQLTQMDVAHGERLAQINRQAGQERTALDDAFEDQLAQLGLHNIAWLGKQKRLQDDATELFEEMWGDWKKTMVDARKAILPPTGGPVERMEPFQEGGWVTRTGPIFAHAGEYVVPANQAASGAGDMSLTIAPGAIVVQESNRPGQTAAEIEAMLEPALIRIFDRVAGP